MSLDADFTDWYNPLFAKPVDRIENSNAERTKLNKIIDEWLENPAHKITLCPPCTFANQIKFIDPKEEKKRNAVQHKRQCVD